MADGIRLGGAFYELTADSAGLVRALSQAEQASKRSVAAISAATGIAERDVQRFASTYIAAEKRRSDAAAASTLKIIRAHNDQAAAAEKAAQQQAQANQAAVTSLASLVKGFAGFAVAAAGVTTGAAAINAAMTSIAESTQKAAQAQFALNALYGKTAPIITKQAEDLAKATGRSRTEALEAATAVANLGRQYALSFEQQQKVLQISANLAAVRGIPLEEATQRVSDALRGEAEAAEYLGQVLNSDAVKAFAKMTDEQRKNFETLSPLTKAQIVFGKLTQDNADLMGKAAERANSSVGAYDKLRASVDNLSVSIGKQFSPATTEAAKALTGLVEQADKFVQSDLAKSMALAAQLTGQVAANILTAKSAYDALLGVQRATAQIGAESRIQVGPDPGLPGAGAGPTPDQAKAIEEARRARERQLAEEQDRIKAFVEERKRQIGDLADAQEKAARRAADAEDDRIERVKIGLEVERAARLKALEERQRNELKAIEAEQRAAEKAAEAEIERLEQEKKLRIEAAEAAADAAKDAIDARKQQYDQERELEDRSIDDARKIDDQQVDDTRAREDRETAALADALKQRRELEDRAIDDRRAAEDAALKDRAQAEDDALKDRRSREDRDLTDAREREDRALDDRANKLRRRREEEDQRRGDSRESEDRAIADRREAQDRADETAHEALKDRLEDEHRQRLAAIESEIAAIEERARAEQRARERETEAARAAAEEASRLRETAYEATLAAYDAEERAQRDAHDALIDQLRDEEDARRQAADAALRSIEERQRAEDDRHRETVANLEAEERLRLGEVDAALDALEQADAADRRAERERDLQDKVEQARTGVKKAESTGNESEILKAQRELDDALRALRQNGVDDERDVQRRALQQRKDIIRQEIEARRQAEQEANRLREQALRDEQDAIRDGLNAELDAIRDRRDAADNALDADLDAIARRRDALRAAYEQEQQAANDALAARLHEIELRGEAYDDETRRLLDGLKARHDAEEEEHKRTIERIDGEYDRARQRIDDQRTAEDRARADRREDEDRELAESRGRQDRALDETKRRIDDRRDREDRARADRRREEDREIQESRQAQERATQERRTAEDRERADRRTAEEIQAQDVQRRLQDQRTAEDRTRQERRTAEDRERADRRTQEDLALSAQLAAINKGLEQERKDTDAHYNGPNGVITTIQKAMEAAKEAYRLRVEDTRLKAEEERAALEAVYRNPAKTGLLDVQDEAARNNREKLNDQLEAIQSWKEASNRYIDDNKDKWKDLAGAIEDVDRRIRNLPRANVTVSGGRSGGSESSYGGGQDSPGQGGGGANPPPPVPPTPGPGIGGGDTEVNVDPDRFSVAFGFNQPYTNPFNPAIPNHRGVDLTIRGADNNGRGMPVGAFRAGTVAAATIDPNGGNGIIIRANDGLYDRYFHFDELNVRQGQGVARGQRIGVLGASGTEGFPHLHYEVSRGINGDPQDQLIDPRPYMRGYATGHLFDEPTMTYGLRSGSQGIIGETGRPERLLGVAATQAFDAGMLSSLPSPSARIASGPIYGEGGAGPIEHLPIEVRLGDMVLEKLVVKGIQLSTSRGVTITDLGLR